MLLTEIDSLKALVGNRSSVPKEQVYPRFDSLAKLWGSFREEVALLEARQAQSPILSPPRLSKSCLGPTQIPPPIPIRRLAHPTSASTSFNLFNPTVPPLKPPPTHPPVPPSCRSLSTLYALSASRISPRFELTISSHLAPPGETRRRFGGRPSRCCRLRILPMQPRRLRLPVRALRVQ